MNVGILLMAYEALISDFSFMWFCIASIGTTEDSILPVEKAWETYHHEIAILGGSDVNYMIMESPEQIITGLLLSWKRQQKQAFSP